MLEEQRKTKCNNEENVCSLAINKRVQEGTLQLCISREIDEKERQIILKKKTTFMKGN